MHAGSDSHPRLQSKAGFTIVELLIVIVVIAILAAISIVAYSGIQTRARDSQRRSDLAQVRKAIEAQYVDTGEYPVPSDAMSSNDECISAPHWLCWGSNGEPSFIQEEYIRAMPQDPAFNDFDACAHPNSHATRAYYYSVTADRQGYTLGTYLETATASDPNYIAPDYRVCGSFINWGFIKE